MVDRKWRTIEGQIRPDEPETDTTGQHRRKDGSTFPVESSVRFVHLDRDYLVSSVRDITERKLADEAFESQLEELQRWHEVMLGREERNVQLKNEVNELLARLNEPARYQEHL